MPRVRVDYTRYEHTCFVDGQVNYTIVCDVTLGRPSASYEEPDDPDEVDFEEVIRYDPIDQTAEDLDPAKWPFRQEEIAVIEEQAIEAAREY